MDPFRLSQLESYRYKTRLKLCHNHHGTGVSYLRIGKCLKLRCPYRSWAMVLGYSDSDNLNSSPAELLIQRARACRRREFTRENLAKI
jgi:hypothetical protein